jgi:hypothetical protein
MKRFISGLGALIGALAVATFAREGRAEGVIEPVNKPDNVAAKAPPPQPPYSLPWALRPIIAPTVLRIESSLAGYENAASERGLTAVTVLTGSYRIEGTGPKAAGLAPMLRLALSSDLPPSSATAGGTIVSNPLVGAGYAMRFDNLRVNAFLAATVPIGGGGGNTPDAGSANARAKALPARVQMDNALFAANDFTLVFGLAGAYVNRGLTLQAEATIFQMMRVRGEAVQKETSKTNFTSGIHAGYFFLPWISAATEVRYQRWLNAPPSVDADATGATKDNLSFAVGPRFHLKLGKQWLRPSVAYERGLDKPLASALQNYHVVRLDVPLLF